MRYKCYGHEAEIREWASQGLGVSEIARRLDVGRRHVRAYLQKQGIAYQRQPQAGPLNPAWKGGTMTEPEGYVLRWFPTHPFANRHGYVREHRLLMERKLGRYLLPVEVVDHRDGNPRNNDLENLRLFASNAEHLRETLKGRIPNWTPEGIARIRAGVAASNLRRSRRGDDASPESSVPMPELPDTAEHNS